MLNQPKSDTAVLLFNYSEKQKASFRQIAPRISNGGLKDLINKLNKRAKKISEKAQLPFFQVDAIAGRNFEEQLYDAYEAIFLKGYNQVIAISNDCPELSSKDLRLAEKKLNSKDIVLGPASDGGLYLLGLKKEKLSREQFMNLNWQTAYLLDSLKERITKLSMSSTQLSIKSDMDTVGEFKKAFESNFQFINELKNQLFSFCLCFFKEIFKVNRVYFIPLLPLRAPPKYR